MIEFLPSNIVKSLAGHDRNNYYHILLSEGEYVLLTDGKLRRLQNPKLKKKKHVEQMGGSDSPAAVKIRTGGMVTNREIIKSLAAYKSGIGNMAEEGKRLGKR